MATDGSVFNTCHHHHNVTFFYNHVGKRISEDWSARDRAVMGLGLSVCVIVVLANLLVMAAILVNRRFHFPIYYLLGNMAAADLFAGIAYANLMLNTGPWTAALTKELWYLRGALIDISLTASIANLLAVAVERHQTVMAMQLHSNMSRRRVLLLIAGIWATAILVGLVPSAFWNCECDLDDCSTVAPLYSRRFLVSWALLNLLAFFVMLAIYARILLYVRYQSGSAAQHTSQTRHNRTLVNLMKTIAMVLGAFVVCWTPGLVTLLLDGLLGKASHANSYEKYCLVIAECNSLVNPIIYSLRDQEMRRTFRCLLCCLCGRGATPRGEPLPVQIHPPPPEETLDCKEKTDQELCKQDISHKDDSWTMLGV